jgi:hypothetical protein
LRETGTAGLPAVAPQDLHTSVKSASDLTSDQAVIGALYTDVASMRLSARADCRLPIKSLCGRFMKLCDRIDIPVNRARCGHEHGADAIQRGYERWL